jgi:DNA-binding XRE family transcriptional regulator
LCWGAADETETTRHYTFESQLAEAATAWYTDDGWTSLSQAFEQAVAGLFGTLAGVTIHRALLGRTLVPHQATAPTGQSVGDLRESESRSEPDNWLCLEALRQIRESSALSWKRVAQLLDVSRQAIYDWQKGLPIADANRQRIFAVHDVIQSARARLRTPAEVAAWLDIPRGRDGWTPAQLLAAGDIDRARFLALAGSSPGLRPLPEWAHRAASSPFREGRERRPAPSAPESDDELAELRADEMG